MSKTKNQNLKSEKIRVAPSLDSETHAMLIRLGVACGLNKTSMAEQIISIALRNLDFVQHLQLINDAREFRIIPANMGGKVVYMDANQQKKVK